MVLKGWAGWGWEVPGCDPFEARPGLIGPGILPTRLQEGSGVCGGWGGGRPIILKKRKGGHRTGQEEVPRLGGNKLGRGTRSRPALGLTLGGPRPSKAHGPGGGVARGLAPEPPARAALLRGPHLRCAGAERRPGVWTARPPWRGGAPARSGHRPPLPALLRRTPQTPWEPGPLRPPFHRLRLRPPLALCWVPLGLQLRPSRRTPQPPAPASPGPAAPPRPSPPRPSRPVRPRPQARAPPPSPAARGRAGNVRTAGRPRQRNGPRKGDPRETSPRPGVRRTKGLLGASERTGRPGCFSLGSPLLKLGRTLGTGRGRLDRQAGIRRSSPRLPPPAPCPAAARTQEVPWP